MKFHSIKMADINKIVKEYWTNTYKGSGNDSFCDDIMKKIDLMKFCE